MDLPVRIVVVNAPAGVTFAVQEGRSALLEPGDVRNGQLAFVFTVRIGDKSAGAKPNFLGASVQGPRDGRFVYVNSGRRAGQHNTEWDRRAKVPLSGIDWPLINSAVAKPGSVVEGRISGTGRDGGPSCGSVDLIGTWRIVE